MAGVWVLAEGREQTLELLNIGQMLAAELGAQLAAFLWEDQKLAQEYIDHGADEVLWLPPLSEDQPLEAYIPTIVEASRQADPDIFLVGGTLRGKDMAARIAAQLNAGLVSGCTSLKWEPAEKRLVMERLVFGGIATQTLVCQTRPQMATVPPRTFTIAAPQIGRVGKIRELPAPLSSVVKVISRRTKLRESADLSEAKVIVGVGRGLAKSEDINLARELASTIGAALGCTRPIAEDLNWMPADSYIGISGQRVKPELYIGVGISGQIHHLTGIRDAKVICAINADENAPIFEAADYGIVGNLYEVLPKLTQEFKKALKK